MLWTIVLPEHIYAINIAMQFIQNIGTIKG